MSSAKLCCGVCGGEIVPLLGRIIEGCRIDWDVWEEGNYEHVEEPSSPHPAVVSTSSV